MHEAPSTGLLSPPVLVYLGIGLASAKILLEGQQLRGIGTLQWLQFFVRAASIVLLWPLVLFIDKFEVWMKSTTEGSPHDNTHHTPAP